MKKILFILFLSSCFVCAFSQNDTTEISATDSTIIGFAKYDLYQRLPEGYLGNFVADAAKTAVQLQWGNKIDVAIISPQSIKGKIDKGTFRKNKILELLPYKDSIAILKADSAQLKNILDRVASQGGGAIAGAQMQINSMRADSIFINSIPINNNENYFVAVPYYLILKNKIPVAENTTIFNANMTLQQAVCEYVIWLTNKGRTISSVPYTRIKYAN